MPATGRLRASDRDRDRAIAALSEHHAEGRLDFAEFTRRMEAAQRATYVDELAGQFADLPRQRLPQPTPPRTRAAYGALWLLPTALIAGVAILVMAHLLPLWLPLVVLWVVAAHHRRGSQGDRWRPGTAPSRHRIRIESCGRSTVLISSRSRSGSPAAGDLPGADPASRCAGGVKRHG